tara:strand:+ start:92 stop:469 length:378 start_codon:yes stop_codon:yes gene_type:complete
MLNRWLKVWNQQAQAQASVVKLIYGVTVTTKRDIGHLQKLSFGFPPPYLKLTSDNQQASRRDNMKINKWGVFVERPDGSTHEIKMYYNSEDYDEKQLDTYIADFIRNLPEDSKNIMPNTKGKILW